MSHISLEPDRDSPPPTKRRRGRQPRPSLLSNRVKRTVSNFAKVVGKPQVIEPAGFRDFRGWLSFIGGVRVAPYWVPVVDAVVHETNGDTKHIEKIKPDLVREIVKAVVIPKEGESSKLVSTNCGRQCARPSNGVTLMTILDRIFSDLHQWDRYRSNTPTFDPNSTIQQISSHDSTNSSILSSHIASSSTLASSSVFPMNSEYQSRLIDAQNVYPTDTNGSQRSQPLPSRDSHFTDPSTSQMSLPSFEELEKSLNFKSSTTKRPRH